MTEKDSSLWRRLRGDTTVRDRRNLFWFFGLMAAWTGAFLGGMALIERGVVADGPLSWGLAALNLVLAGAALLAYVRYLRETDELQRRIHLEALALGFGGGWVAVAGYRLFELLGAPYLERGLVILVMAIFYTLGLALGRWRYS